MGYARSHREFAWSEIFSRSGKATIDLIAVALGLPARLSS
jgi:hypothetical protein